MNYNRKKFIKQECYKILERFNVSTPPIQIKSIAEKFHINVTTHNLSDDVSGILIIKGKTVMIGYNPNHSRLRQRFTIAHELGHYVLNHQRDGLFVDKINKPKNDFAVFFRNNESSTGEYQQEVEANAFAAELLMPEHIVIEKVEQYGLDLSDENEETIIFLANLFEVSKQAMSFRIGNIFSTY